MKIAIIFLAGLSLCFGSTYVLEQHMLKTSDVAPQNLDDLFQQFANFIPFDKCVEIVNKYVETDPGVKQAYDYIRSDGFQALLTQLEDMPEYKEFVKYLYDSGFNYYKYINLIRKIFDLPPITPPLLATREDSGIIKMIKEILGTLPIDDMKKWFLTVCLPDPAYQAFLDRIRSPEFGKLVDLVYNSQQYMDIKEILRSQGVDVDQIEESINDFLNGSFKFIPRSLPSLLQEFISYIPTRKIGEIFAQYVRDNDDIKNIITYVKGDEFRALIVKIEALQEFKDFLALIYGYGLNVYDALNIVLDILGLPTVSPAEINRIPSVQSGLTDMINEMLALIPLKELADWYHTKCEPDPEFQDVLAHLRSDDFQVIVNVVKGDPAFQTIQQGLIDLDVNVANVDAFLHDFFGW